MKNPRRLPEKGCDYNRHLRFGLAITSDSEVAACLANTAYRRFFVGENPPSAIMNSPYTLLTSEAEYRQACDTVLGRAQRELLIFDRDLAALQLESSARLDLLSGFLQGDALRRIRIVLHDPAAVERQAPRLVQFIVRFSHAIEVRQSPDNLRHLADTHLLADGCHGVRRFHIDQPRSALVLDDRTYLHPWQQRFEELWQLSHPCLRISTTGL